MSVVRHLQLPMAVNAWDLDDIKSFQSAMNACGLKTDVWLISREGNDAYVFALPASKPPSHNEVAKAFHRLLVLEKNAPGPSVSDTRNILLREFKRIKV